MSARTASELFVFDTETTGVDATTDRIVTAYAAVIGPDGHVRREVNLVVDPGVEIPAGAAAVHGYTNERARAEANASPASAVALLINLITTECAIGGRPLVVHNASYDLTLLEAERRRHAPAVPPLRFAPPTHPISAQNQAVRVIDTLVLDKKIDPYRRGKRTLTVMAEHYSVPLSAEDAHNASSDAVAAGRIAQRLLRHKAVAALSLDTLHARQVGWRERQCESLQAYFRKTDPTAVVRPEWPLLPL
ncbi:DNA polymerase-3 subunit epsilon [Microbacterium marinum]|uniref:DNA polymerase-3 subunit epsilon n=1 Tax=Microbacterium marinum TaxID=421115 RepID=A0A7W7BQL2_9MICO|nr:exonuclease domain-containing protein [Microbacterium marinum]MBB4667030.1 DNA polymerase-3 subunit epsilon [Microbacterium marinum]